MTPNLALLQKEAARRAVRFLLIGGYAVNAHGYSRKTFDIDLMIQREDSSVWREIMKAGGYECVHEHLAFLQFSAQDMPPIDLMRVNESTFAQLFAESQLSVISGVEMQVPSLDHLFAMKLHAAKDAPPHRRFKDLIDIFYLVEVNRVDVSTEKFRAMCAKYGTPELYAEIVKSTRKPGS